MTITNKYYVKENQIQQDNLENYEEVENFEHSPIIDAANESISKEK